MLIGQHSAATATSGTYVTEWPPSGRFDPRSEYWDHGFGLSFRYTEARNDIPILSIPDPNYFIFELDQQWHILAYTHEVFELDQQWSVGIYVTFEALSDTLPLADEASFQLYISMTAIEDLLPLADAAAFERIIDMGVPEDTLPLNDSASFLLELIFELIEDRLPLEDEAEFLTGTDTGYEGWVLNVDSNATGRYNWAQGFNSFAELNERFYAAADDGIYELTGADDEGTAIDAIAVMGQIDYDVPGEKRVRAVYVNARTDGGLFVRVVLDDNQTFSYVVEHSDIEELQSRRAVLGRGLRGVNWQFAVGNIDGADAEIERLTSTPTEFSRRRG